MSTADVFMEIRSGRLVGADDLKDRVLGYLKSRVADLGARVYNYPGVFSSFTLTSPGANMITVAGTGYATDGLGNILRPSLCVDGADNFMASVGFENALGVTYYVVMKYAELPSGAQQNSKGFPEFTGTREFIGESGDPDGVTDNGNGTITFQINGLLESVKSTPRKAYVWLKVPQSSSSEHKQLCTISWNGATNTITTTHKLGQTTVTTDASKYTVLIPGPTIRRYTNFEAGGGVAGYVNIGRVTGTGNGNVPVTFSTEAQNLIDTSLSSLNAVLDAYATRVSTTGNAGISASLAGTARYNFGCVPFGGLIYAIGGDGSLASGGCVSQVHSYNPGTNSWTVKASVPSQNGAPAARSGMGVVASATKIYVLGGGDESLAPNMAYSVVQVYDPNTNTWGSSLASMPGARRDMFCALIGDTIYVMGGVDNNGTETSTVWSYSIANNAWTVLTPMANTYSEGASATLNGTFYKVGGLKNTFVDAEVWQYNPIGGWVQRASLPITLRGLRCVVQNGVLIACGGRNASNIATKSFYAYNESRNEWTDLGEMPGQPIRDHGFAIIDGIARVIGGVTTQSTDSIVSSHCKVDVSQMAIATGAGIVSATGTTYIRVGSGTTAISAKPSAMRSAPSVTANGRVYFVCGETSAGAASQELWCYHPETDTYERLPDCPFARMWGGAVYHARENAIYAFGGQTGGFPQTTLDRYDIATRAWTSLTVSPTIDRCGFGQGVLAGDKIYMFGGGSGGVTTASTGGQIIHLRSRTTSFPAALPAARRWTLNFALPKSAGLGVADSGHHIYVMGGDAGANVLSTIYVYDTDLNTFATHGATLSANRGYAQVEAMPGTMKAAIIGGVAVTNTATNLVTIYDFATMTSTNITNLSASRLLPSAAYIGGLFYMFSGSSGTSAAMTGQTTASYTYDSAYAAPELSLPKNYTTGRTAHTFGVRSGHLYGAHSWLANEAAEFIVAGDQ